MITLILGGARSGKSSVGEQLAMHAGDGGVSYVATARLDGDEDLHSRVERHRSRRPNAWSTLEHFDDLPTVLREVQGVILVDSLGTWLSSLPEFTCDLVAICDALKGRSAPTIIVSDEVGLGVHPETEMGRLFRDALGELNEAVAAVADVVLLVVAGRVLPLNSIAGI